MNYKILALALAFACWSCGAHDGHDHEAEDHDGHDHEHAEAHASDEIILEPEMAQRLGVEVETVTPGDFSEVVAVTGEILASPGSESVASAPKAGRVVFAPGITEGATVSAGQRIATVTADGVAGGDSSEGARAALEAARAEMERARPLADEGIVSRKEWNAIVAAYEAARAAFTPSAATGTVTAPASGVISSLSARQGEFVEKGQAVAVIASSRQLTLRADVPERHASMLHRVRDANIKPAGSDRVVALSSVGGRLASSGSSTAVNGYRPVSFTFQGRGEVPVAAGSFVDVWLIGDERHDVISVPIAALTEQQGAIYVYVQIDDEGYERRAVSVGGSDGRRVEILSGLRPGDRVVTAGASAVRLAENSGAVPEGHSHNH